MRFFRNILLYIVLEVFVSVVQIANMFLSNIAIYEATTGLKFDFSLLFENLFFWIVLILQLAYTGFCIIIKVLSKSADADAVKAINDTLDQMAAISADEYKNRLRSGDFVGTTKILKRLKKIKKERRK